MAIAYYGGNYGYAGAGSSTNVTVDVGSGTDRFLVVGVSHNSPPYSSYNANDITGITYNGTALTRITSQAITGYQGVGVSLWVLHNPSSGSNTLTVSHTAASYPEIFADAYTGVNQASSVDASNSSTATSADFSVSVTTTADNTWLVGVFRAENTLTAKSGTTFRQPTSGNGMLADSNGAKTPTGSYSLGVTLTSSRIGGIVVSLAPATATTNSNSNFFAFM